jgi:3-hydroxyisobutyrate dehydrogenase-like beta-hydroxyacid dehydrogenase
MVGKVVSMVYAHKMSLDVGMYAKTISTGAYRSRSLDLYVDNILVSDYEHGLSVNHFVKDLSINLKNL